MTTTKGKKMIDKVRALIAKAESTEHPAEAEAFMAKANQLMLEHAIAKHQLADTPEMVRVEATRLGSSSLSVTKRIICVWAVIGEAHGVLVLVGKRMSIKANGKVGSGTDDVIILVGKSDMVEAVTMLGNRLTVDCMAAASNITSKTLPESAFAEALVSGLSTSQASLVRHARCAFIMGYADEIDRRFQAMNKTVDTANDGSLLPVLRDDLKAAEEFVGGKLRSGRSVTAHNSGRAAGRAAGAKANLAGGSMPKARKALGR
jgi:hypothetical protein